MSSAGLAYDLTLTNTGFGWFSSGYCPARDLYDSATALWWPARAYLPLAWYAGLPGVVLAFLVHWAAIRRGRPRAGRILARVAVAPLLVLYGLAPLAFAFDIARDAQCLDRWGGSPGVGLFIVPDTVAVVAALCALAAVRVPRHRAGRLLRSVTRLRWARRSAVPLAALALVAFLPVADLAAGGIIRRPCELRPVEGSASGVFDVLPFGTGERAFLCDARAGGRFRSVSDRDLIAYGRAVCDAYRPGGSDQYFAAAICPPVEADLRRRKAAEEAEFHAREAADQRVCDAARHRPLTRPVRVMRTRMGTDYGVIESFETEEAFDDDLLRSMAPGDLVAAVPGHLIILTHSDFDNCLTAELYRRRPPVEVKGWDRVVEIGYQSPTGHIGLMDSMVGESDLPDLALGGRGCYRVRVHYREPEWEAGTPQHLLIVVYPGSGRRTVEYLPGS
ncbi:hypothetical protein [Microbispora bryophytorum]|uniref:Integral membrane protein n=1 Tax=Microbispora bryophytorum subsp. camponoti TaxID=1677852 RepID=A0ABR8LF40_9ACTN|nr:hypothetical protein [Microbispora camponoti]MBD3148459.1 hypothetical protein [Microbispora camponoti]